MKIEEMLIHDAFMGGGGSGGEYKEEILWENPKPNNAFTYGKLTEAKGYDAIKIIWIRSNSSEETQREIYIKLDGKPYEYLINNYRQSKRAIIVDKDYAIAASTCTLYDSSREIQTQCIPIAVYGIK